MSKFKISGNQFMLNDKPYRILSGAIHYFRVVPEYWKDRFLKLKACGLNTVETCIAWNLHEPKKDEYNFSGIADIVKFINIAQETGLNVILRPGPYICAEWDFGGLPAWLLAEENIKLRCYNKPYLDRVDKFFDVLFEKIRPLLCSNGGPVIAVQLENEYGSYGNDKRYLEHLKHKFIDFGINCVIFTSDGPTDVMLESGTLPDIYKTVNFGSGSVEAFKKLEKYQKDKPIMCMEYWNGWFDHWGEEHHIRSYNDAAEELDNILEQGASVNLYMFHGGTNFGFFNGANYQEKYEPTVTSYDYNSPLTEDGHFTKKFFEFRNVLSKYTKIAETEVLQPIERKAYGKVKLTEKQGLFGALQYLSSPVEMAYPVPMEELNQNFGFILYRTRVKGIRKNCEIDIKEVHDRAQIFVNGEYKDTVYRPEYKKVIVDFDKDENVLDILIENMGRVNYGQHLMDYKGITEGVRLDYQYQFQWEIFTLPLDNIERIRYDDQNSNFEPTFYRGYFIVDEPKDTYFSIEDWEKGNVFINGFNIGRYWSIGPQKTLYIPAPLLKKGQNEIVVFDLKGIENPIANLADIHKL